MFADVGTDHGYLPIALLRAGKIRRAILTDINEGPLSAAKENIRITGFLDRTEFLLADGAAMLEGRGVTDLAICGMGGELIAAIIADAPFLRDPSLRLILQPMTRAAVLRRYLAGAGFVLEQERYAAEAGRAYVCLCVSYTGEVCSPDDLFCEFGTLLARKHPTAAERLYLRTRRNALAAARDGKLRGGENADYEIAMTAAADAAIRKYEIERSEESK